MHGNEKKVVVERDTKDQKIDRHVAAASSYAPLFVLYPNYDVVSYVMICLLI